MTTCVLTYGFHAKGLKLIVPTDVVYFYKVSQYRKYTQTNIRIHFINITLTKTYPLTIFLFLKN